MTDGRKRLFRLGVLLSILAIGAVAVWDALSHENGVTAALLRATHALWDKPAIFGPFHLTMLAVCLVVAALAFLLRQKVSVARLDDVVFAAGVLLFFLELYKQLYFWVVLGNGTYNFGILPLQFCSYALYLFLLIPLLPEGKAKDILYAFCALYQTMGGCIVMAYPVLYAEVSLAFHTMLWHTVMIAVGVLVLCLRGYGRRYLGELLPTTVLFLLTMTVATVLNLCLTPYTEGSLQPLNLFYMSPYETNSYILISDVRRAFGWIPSLICYALLFIFVGATLMWTLGRLYLLWEKHSKKSK